MILWLWERTALGVPASRTATMLLHDVFADTIPVHDLPSETAHGSHALGWQLRVKRTASTLTLTCFRHARGNRRARLAGVGAGEFARGERVM